MRNYIQVEKTEDGLFLSEGKGTEPDDYDVSKHWEPWEEFESEEKLFERIKEIFSKNE